MVCWQLESTKHTWYSYFLFYCYPITVMIHRLLLRVFFFFQHRALYYVNKIASECSRKMSYAFVDFNTHAGEFSAVIIMSDINVATTHTECRCALWWATKTYFQRGKKFKSDASNSCTWLEYKHNYFARRIKNIKRIQTQRHCNGHTHI